jgi:hypothetical protein
MEPPDNGGKGLVLVGMHAGWFVDDLKFGDMMRAGVATDGMSCVLCGPV